MSAPLLFAQELVLDYGRTRALDGITLAVEPGELLALVGPSGSGKTSLLHCLSGMIRPDAGRILFKGQAVESLPERSRDRLRREEFGFVFQFGELVPELTIVENVALPLRLQGEKRKSAERRAVDQLDLLGVGHLGARRVGEVSGGEMQRAAIARALVHRPSIVFADEPTGALDEENRELVLLELLKAATESAAAVVLVTHEMSLAGRAGRRISMAAGRLEPNQ